MSDAKQHLQVITEHTEEAVSDEAERNDYDAHAPPHDVGYAADD